MNINENICSQRATIIHSLQQFLKLQELCDKPNEEIIIIIVEEIVSFNWKKIKEAIKKFKIIYLTLKKTVFWNIENMKKMTEHFFHKINGPFLSPCKFSKILLNLLKKKENKINITFLIWVLESPSRCLQVFKYNESMKLRNYVNGNEHNNLSKNIRNEKANISSRKQNLFNRPSRNLSKINGTNKNKN
jgi:hypothetical protein